MGASNPILIMRVVGPGAPGGPRCWCRRRTHPFLRQAREVRSSHAMQLFKEYYTCTVLLCVHIVYVELTEHVHCSDRPLFTPFRQAREGMDCLPGVDISGRGNI